MVPSHGKIPYSWPPALQAAIDREPEKVEKSLGAQSNSLFGLAIVLSSQIRYPRQRELWLYGNADKVCRVAKYRGKLEEKEEDRAELMVIRRNEEESTGAEQKKNNKR